MGFYDQVFSGYQTPELVVGTNPAANTELGDTVPAGQLWLLLSVSVSLVQGATQTPQPILQLTDGTHIFWEGVGSSAAQTASTTCQYTWSHGYSANATGQIGATTDVHSFAPFPDTGVILRPGWVIQTHTIGIGANSDYGAPVYCVVKGTHT